MDDYCKYGCEAESLQSEIDKLYAEVKALKADAERYRWLRGKQLVGNQPGSWKTISDRVIDNLRGEGK